MNTFDDNCLFCKIVRGIIPSDCVYQDEHLFVFKDINPKAAVHLLVVPKYHVRGLDDVGDKDDTFLAHALKQLQHLATAHGLDSGFRTIINTGSGGGQEVFHLHLHLLGDTNLGSRGFNNRHCK